MRKRAIRTVVEIIFYELIIILIVAFTVAYPVMLSLGALHSEWVFIPAFGWWETYLHVVAFFFAVSTTRVILAP